MEDCMTKDNDSVLVSTTEALAAMRVIFKMVMELAALHPEVWNGMKKTPKSLSILRKVLGS